MENDILSLYLANNNAFYIIKKCANISLVILCLAIVYSCIDIADWVKYLNTKANNDLTTAFRIYYRRVRPFLGVITLGLSIVAHANVYTGYKLLVRSIKEKNDTMIIDGFSKFYLGAMLNVISYLLYIASIIFRVFIL